MTSEPRAFGKARQIKWLPVGSEDPEILQDQHGAARLQHEVAIAIQERAIDQHGTVKAYAAATGVNYPRLSAILRGDLAMKLDDLISAHRHLGIRIRFGSSTAPETGHRSF